MSTWDQQRDEANANIESIASSNRNRMLNKNMTFDQWMAKNNLSSGYGPGYVYSQQGGSYDKQKALQDWRAETGQGGDTASTLSALLSGGSAGNENAFGGAPTMNTANAFGAAPTLNTSNRFEAGLGDAEGRLRNLLDNPDSINQSAAYKFRVGQGQEALQRSMGAKGMLNSGNRLMELTKYGQDMGSQEYGAQADRLGSLLGNYSQSWLGDKNANTSRFTAQSNAWLGGEKANTDRFSTQSGAWNTAQGNADQNRYRMGSLAWEMSKPQSGGGTIRSSGGMNPIQNSPFASNLGHIGGYTPFSEADNSYGPQPGTMAYNDLVSANNKRQTY